MYRWQNNKLEEQRAFVIPMYQMVTNTCTNKKKTDTDAGVGKHIILNGTGPYKYLTNKECIYAVKYMKDHAFVTTKCTITKIYLIC